MLGKKRLKLGVVANEFFDKNTGRMGGFGWATRQVARCFQANPELGVEVVYISGENQSGIQTSATIHNTRLLPKSPSKVKTVRNLWSENFDLLFSIDYRPNYRSIFWSLPRTPIIIWVRDPRPPEDMEKIQTVRIPQQDNQLPKGLITPDCTSLSQVVKYSKWLSRPVLFGTPASFLRAKVPGTYGVTQADVKVLPNIIDLDPGEIKKSKKPSVVFLARLDPYKRPWIFVEIARHFPDVNFIFLGQPHFHGEGAWKPEDLPENVHLKGHVEGKEKINYLSSAWALINTSIHEGLAVSFQEALRCETPLLSCVNPEDIVSRFGIYVGRHDGDGLSSVPHFIEGLQRLLSKPKLRLELGRDGRSWVESLHNQANFITVFGDLCKEAKVL